jgi:prophage antirepressor-like protein
MGYCKMSKLMRFDYGDSAIRIRVDGEGDPWFVAIDLEDVTGIKNIRDACRGLDADERCSVGYTDRAGRPKKMDNPHYV